MKKFSRAFSIAVLSAALVACSSGPSDSDVQAALKDTIKQVEQVYAAWGINFSETFDIDVKVKNKSKQDDGRWLVQTETIMRAKKDWVKGKKGEVVGQPQTDNVYMVKGDSGWIIQNAR